MSAPSEARSAPQSDSGAFRLTGDAGDGRLAAEGTLTFASARGARQLGLDAVHGATAERLEIDCSRISASDSAGLAVLLDWLAAAKAQGRSLRFSNLPQGLAALGRISEVDELLGRGV
jgi:phospholipid transport system transporter-binding protein